MNAIATTSQRSLPANISEPRFSDNLERAIDGHINPIPGVKGDRILPAISQEAARHLMEYDHLCSPPSSETVIAWLWPIVASSSNPPDQASFRLRATAIARACELLPKAVFTADSQREAMGRFKFFPGAAEVIEFLKPDSIRLTSRRRALKAIARTGAPAEEERKPRSVEERDAILANFRPRFAEAVEQTRKQLGLLTDRPRAAHLRPDQLAEAYHREAEFDPGRRAAMLRMSDHYQKMAKRSKPPGADLRHNTAAAQELAGGRKPGTREGASAAVTQESRGDEWSEEDALPF